MKSLSEARAHRRSQQSSKQLEMERKRKAKEEQLGTDEADPKTKAAQAAQENQLNFRIEHDMVNMDEAGGEVETTSPDFLSRLPDPWESIYSWIWTISAKDVPPGWVEGGQISRPRALTWIQSTIKCINDQLEPQWRTDLTKWRFSVAVEMPLKMSELLLHDHTKKQITQHPHFSVQYCGRQCKTSHLFSKICEKLGYKVDIRTFEVVRMYLNCKLNFLKIDT